MLVESQSQGSELNTERGLDRLQLSPLAGGVFAFIIFYLFTALTFSLVVGQDGAADAQNTGLLVVCQLPSCLILLIMASFWPMGLPWLGNPRVLRTILLYCLFLALWYPLTFGYSWLLDRLEIGFESQAQLAYFLGSMDGWLPWVAAFTVCVAGPIAEEIIFRGYLHTGMVRVLGKSGGWVLVAMAFGLVHGLMYALPMFGMGLFLGYLRQSSGGLAAPIIVHVLHNTHTVLMARFFPSLIE